jgi:hypothetical protein
MGTFVSKLPAIPIAGSSVFTGWGAFRDQWKRNQQEPLSNDPGRD